MDKRVNADGDQVPVPSEPVALAPDEIEARDKRDRGVNERLRADPATADGFPKVETSYENAEFAYDQDIVAHHDGYGVNELIRVEHDPPGTGGAPHAYRFLIDDNGPNEVGNEVTAGWIQFQHGPRKMDWAVPGITESALLAVLIHRLESFQNGAYKDADNGKALDQLRGALGSLQARSEKRAKRNVLGTATP
jgi:hypothetical protein